MTVDQMTEALAQAQADDRRLKEALRNEKAQAVLRWRQAPEGPEKDREGTTILKIDEALCEKNWIQLRWEAEGRE